MLQISKIIYIKSCLCVILNIPLQRKQIFISLMSNILKYRILELKKKNGDTIKSLATKCQVTEMGMRLWMYMPISNTGSIPSDKLKIIADHYGISMNEMYTQPDLITA
jgi:hypothetical protein